MPFNAALKKCLVLFASHCVQWHGKIGTNTITTVFKRWRQFLLKVHPDRNRGKKPTSEDLRLIADGNGGAVGGINAQNKTVRRMIFSLAFLSELGVFEDEEDAGDFAYETTEGVIDALEGFVNAYTIMANDEKLEVDAQNAFNAIVHDTAFNSTLAAKFKVWDATNAKASKSKSKSRARAQSVRSRVKGRAIGPPRSRRLIGAAPELSDIILSRSRSAVVPHMRADVASLNRKRPCADPNKIRHPVTKRCRKVRPNTRLKQCGANQERNPATNRCRRVPAGRRPCRPGQERNPATGRCRKMR